MTFLCKSKMREKRNQYPLVRIFRNKKTTYRLVSGLYLLVISTPLNHRKITPTYLLQAAKQLSRLLYRQ